MIKENSFNREKSNRIKNFMLEMKGCSLCNCFYLNTDKYTHGSNKGRGFDLLTIEKVYNSFIKKQAE